MNTLCKTIKEVIYLVNIYKLNDCQIVRLYPCTLAEKYFKISILCLKNFLSLPFIGKSLN